MKKPARTNNRQTLSANSWLETMVSRYRFPIFIAGFLCIALGLYMQHMAQQRHIADSMKPDMQTIPKEIRNAIKTSSPIRELRVPILLYHYVEHIKDPKDTIRLSLTTTPQVFEAQVKTLKEAGYTFLTASDLKAILDGIRPLPEKPILLTFDDGHWDLATDVLPILIKYKAIATAYIISGFIGKSDFLSSSQLRQVIQSGLVEIGSHTVNHISLAKEPLTIVADEVRKSKYDLEHTYGLHIVSFAYPSGSFDSLALEAVKSVGYKSAMSTIPGIMQSNTNTYFLYRIRPGGRTGDALLTFLNQNHFKNW